MLKYVILVALALVLSPLSDGAQSAPSPGAGDDGARATTDLGPVYDPAGFYAYTLVSSAGIIQGKVDPALIGTRRDSSPELPPSSRDVHADGKRDLRLACPHYVDEPTIQKCREWEGPPP